jgi:hypothetical protein
MPRTALGIKTIVEGRRLEWHPGGRGTTGSCTETAGAPHRPRQANHKSSFQFGCAASAHPPHTGWGARTLGGDAGRDPLPQRRGAAIHSRGVWDIRRFAAFSCAPSEVHQAHVERFIFRLRDEIVGDMPEAGRQLNELRAVQDEQNSQVNRSMLQAIWLFEVCYDFADARSPPAGAGTPGGGNRIPGDQAAGGKRKADAETEMSPAGGALDLAWRWPIVPRSCRNAEAPALPLPGRSRRRLRTDCACDSTTLASWTRQDPWLRARAAAAEVFRHCDRAGATGRV